MSEIRAIASTAAPWGRGGAWISHLRRSSEITLRECAEQIGAPSVRWAEDVEAGLRPVPSSMYAAYAKVFGLDLRDFAATCLRHYDRKAFEALFGVESQEFSAAA
ncbi:MAG: hypothetical protein QNJ84_08415 [Alphaproteobacteria bacterium]|nr:hypothetical protein [Alphaproteobacteria bacterium]